MAFLLVRFFWHRFCSFVKNVFSFPLVFLYDGGGLLEKQLPIHFLVFGSLPPNHFASRLNANVHSVVFP